MKKRHVCLLGLGAAWTTGGFLLACGGGSGGSFTDGGSDGATDTTTDHMMSTFDGHAPDNSQPQPDVIGSDSKLDGGSDAPFDSGLVGNCSPVNGPACDIVKQNCPSGKECVILESADAALGVTTACEPTQTSEHLPVGHACCPNPSANPCDKGLTCIGANCVSDAGGGTCSPACCPGGDGGMPSNNCGTSPEGYLGQCDLSITQGSDELFTACTYSQKCIPLDVAPCGTGYTCSVDNDAGAGDCIQINGPDGGTTGAPPGATCMFDNYCAAGLLCAGTSTTSNCLWECYVGGTTPFDAGLVDASTGALGHGGCPSGYTCDGVTGFPSWLGVCVPP
jgi:hypothetical protein